MNLRVTYTSDLNRSHPEIDYTLDHLCRVAGLTCAGSDKRSTPPVVHVHYGGSAPAISTAPVVWIRSSRFFLSDYGTTHALPTPPYQCIAGVPVLFRASDGPTEWRAFPGGLETASDIVASAFVLLSGYEEHISPMRDDHDRFIARDSVVAAEGLSSIPLVDRYAGILRSAVSELSGVPVGAPSWDGRGFALALTHDVDSLRRPRRYIPGKTASKPKRTDTPLRAVHAVESAHGVHSTIFFLVHSHPQDKHPYDFQSDEAQAECREALERGAEIGLHGSYDCFYSNGGPREELEILRQSHSAACGFRQHYLRLPAHALHRLADAGIVYDMSLGWPDRPGFRHGTAWPFHPFCFERRAALSILEIPLIVMDRTLEKYCSLDAAAAEQASARILEQVKSSGGCASVLWHHEFFDDVKHPGFTQLYEWIIRWLLDNGGRALTGSGIAHRFETTIQSGTTVSHA